jgi:hypothetical protein
MEKFAVIATALLSPGMIGSGNGPAHAMNATSPNGRRVDAAPATATRIHGGGFD